MSVEVEKGKGFLSEGDEMVEVKDWDLGGNGYYYGWLDGVEGVLIGKGVNGESDGGIKRELSLELVKSGMVDMSYGSLVGGMLELREKGD